MYIRVRTEYMPCAYYALCSISCISKMGSYNLTGLGSSWPKNLQNLRPAASSDMMGMSWKCNQFDLTLKKSNASDEGGPKNV